MIAKLSICLWILGYGRLVHLSMSEVVVLSYGSAISVSINRVLGYVGCLRVSWV